MKPVQIKVLRLSAIALLLGGLTSVVFGWLSLPHVPVKKVSELEKERDVKSTIYLRGKVVKHIPFVGSKAYELKDSTGAILVLTKKDFPPLKKDITIQGELNYKSIPLAGQDLGEFYVNEQKRY